MHATLARGRHHAVRWKEEPATSMYHQEREGNVQIHKSPRGTTHSMLTSPRSAQEGFPLIEVGLLGRIVLRRPRSEAS